VACADGLRDGPRSAARHHCRRCRPGQEIRRRTARRLNGLCRIAAKALQPRNRPRSRFRPGRTWPGGVWGGERAPSPRTLRSWGTAWSGHRGCPTTRPMLDDRATFMAIGPAGCRVGAGPSYVTNASKPRASPGCGDGAGPPRHRTAYWANAGRVLRLLPPVPCVAEVDDLVIASLRTLRRRRGDAASRSPLPKRLRIRRLCARRLLPGA